MIDQMELTLSDRLVALFEDNEAVRGRLTRECEAMVAENAVLSSWTRSDLVMLVSGHPRIGETGAMSETSRREQAGKNEEDEAVLERLRVLNAHYESLYPMRYVTFVNGRSKGEIADELQAVLEKEVDVSGEMERATRDLFLIAAQRAQRLEAGSVS